MNLNLKLLNQLLANIKGNYIAKNKYARLKYNKGILKILYFLKVHGYILNYRILFDKKRIQVYLKYKNSIPFITEIIHYSKPSNISIKYIFDFCIGECTCQRIPQKKGSSKR